LYKPGVWCKYYYHIAIPLTFASSWLIMMVIIIEYQS
jgi:hypothetical protein